MKVRIAITIALLSIFFGTSCASWFPGKVASGIARLTVKNLGTITSLINADTACGFESQEAIDSVLISGTSGKSGIATWRIENCTLDFGSRGVAVSEDCHGNKTYVSGKVTITATRTIEGVLTGDPLTPAVPNRDDSIRIDFEKVRFDNFKVRSSNSEDLMIMKSGSLSGSVVPRMAESTNYGVCQAATGIARFEDIRYNKSTVRIEGGNNFDADVQSSNFDAQAGKWGSRENYLGGHLTVWDEKESVPTEGDEDGLDPSYTTAKKYEDSFVCGDEIRTPLSHQCDLDPLLGGGAGRLSMQTLGTLLSMVAGDEHCGFASQAAEDSLTWTGEVGRRGGEAVYTVTECYFDFPEPTVLSTDCDGIDTIVQGRAVISGTQVLRGWLTGAAYQPIVPDTSNPVTVNLVAELTGFSARSSDEEAPFIDVYSGTLSGSASPRTIMDSETSACSAPSSRAQFENVVWDGGHMRMVLGAKAFEVDVTSSNLWAINGQIGEQENVIGGTIVANQKTINIEETGWTELNPSYDADTFFDSTLSCNPNLSLPKDEEECSFEGFLATGAARLLIGVAGFGLQFTGNDQTCGFASIDGILPVEVLGEDEGTLATASWGIEQCTINDSGDEKILMGTDCAGSDTFFQGLFQATATKTVTGVLAGAYPPIQPLTRNDVRITFDAMVLDDFAVASREPGQEAFGPYMVIDAATMSATTYPITGESASHPNTYSVGSSVVIFEGVQISPTQATIHYEGMQFKLDLGGALLHGQNGAYRGVYSLLGGTITSNGVTYDIPEQPLVEDFSLEASTASYICAEDLLEAVPAD